MANIPERLAGWQAWGGDEPFEDHAGPFYMLPDASGGGQHLCAFIAESRHMNGGGYLHGGMLMTFADYALFIIAYDELRDHHSVTVSCQVDFLRGSAPLGELVFADGEVTRNTKTLIFVRGRIYHESAPDDSVATFTGILKKITARKTDS